MTTSMREMGGVRPVSVRGTRIESIPFSVLRGQARLFLDHQAHRESVSPYYPAAVSHHSNLEDRIAEVLASFETDRAAVCSALEQINEDYGASDETRANIGLLSRDKTVAVLTGQQAGLFSGPLYTIYKALSAIRSAGSLRSRGIGAVPVFWMATEDHDLDEVANGFVTGRDGTSVRLSILPDDAEVGKPVGSVILNRSVETAIRNMFETLPSTEYSRELCKKVSEIWTSGKDIATAFGKTLTWLMGKYGLILADPRNPTLKTLAAPVYASAIDKSEAIVEALRSRSEELVDAGYHAQVQVGADYFPLFWHTDEGKRVALRRGSDGSIKIKGQRDTFTLRELQKLSESSPERFSPGVMLRPVVQDFLFPTICYFGGAAEVTYFAQNSEVYRVMQRPATPIFHRQSFTVVESRHSRTLEKYGIEFLDLFEGEDALLRMIVEKFIDPGTASLFDEVEASVGEELDRLGEALAGIDGTLAANLTTRRRKISYHLGALRKKFQRRRAETNETIARRVKAAVRSLAPQGVLQERSLNVFTFLNMLGPRFIDTVYEAVDLNDGGHRVIYL
ncbi:MAG TPA: bacillithiol biosynthesis cysteine-adding enzyme BshC [Pyrinomonadaceae bacterium]|nr:bacillithiol biosynthesis cysteine-adding enzyme BshC [Pyrinomonadaceae bacterium]